jgi:uncharacterized protein (DUF1330 family)
MAAYVIVDIEVTDAAGYDAYRQRSGATIAAFGGKFLVRGGPAVTLEGTWRPQRLVVIEFESVEQARAWWSSEQYRPVRDIRWKTARSHLLIAEGLA